MSTATPRHTTPAAVGVVAGLLLAAGLVLAAGLAAGDDTPDQPAGRTADQVSEPAVGHSPPYPSSMDALGASVTVGFNTDCLEGWIDCPDNSWSTGTNPAVDSVYLRLLALTRD
jgi:hypothetical protein